MPLQTIAEKLNLGGYHRHVFLCAGPKCCAEEVGLASWETLKRLLKEQNLATGEHACYRTRAACLRVCTEGPTMLVYPEGTWYSGMTADRMLRLVKEHLIEGKPIEEWVFARNPLDE